MGLARAFEMLHASCVVHRKNRMLVAKAAAAFKAPPSERAAFLSWLQVHAAEKEKRRREEDTERARRQALLHADSQMRCGQLTHTERER